MKSIKGDPSSRLGVPKHTGLSYYGRELKKLSSSVTTRGYKLIVIPRGSTTGVSYGAVGNRAENRCCGSDPGGGGRFDVEDKTQEMMVILDPDPGGPIWDSIT